MKTCSHCGRELPDEQFERYPSGTRRAVCRHCHYLLHTRAAVRRWRLKEKIRMIMNH